MGTLPADAATSPMTFAAVNQAADKFLPYRNQGYEMLMVIVANTAGSDWDQLLTRRFPEVSAAKPSQCLASAMACHSTDNGTPSS